MKSLWNDNESLTPISGNSYRAGEMWYRSICLTKRNSKTVEKTYHRNPSSVSAGKCFWRNRGLLRAEHWNPLPSSRWENDARELFHLEFHALNIHCSRLQELSSFLDNNSWQGEVLKGTTDNRVRRYWKSTLLSRIARLRSSSFTCPEIQKEIKPHSLKNGGKFEPFREGNFSLPIPKDIEHKWDEIWPLQNSSTHVYCLLASGYSRQKM